MRRSVEATKSHGLRLKPPKTPHGRRTMPPMAIAVLGLGKLEANHFVFGEIDGAARHPDWMTYHWKRVAKQLGLAKVTLHALPHSHASALIATGQDVVTVSRRIGHASPAITLSVYATLFDQTDRAAADAIEGAMKPTANKP